MEKAKSIFTKIFTIKRVITFITIFILLTAFISYFASFQLFGTSQRIFTREQIEVLQYEFEFILPNEARIVYFRWSPNFREPDTIAVSIAGIRDLDGFLENNLLFELTTLESEFVGYNPYLRKHMNAIVYRAAIGSHIGTRELSPHSLMNFRRTVVVNSTDDSEIVIVTITQRTSFGSSPYEQTFMRMIRLNAPFQLYKKLLGLD